MRVKHVRYLVLIGLYTPRLSEDEPQPLPSQPRHGQIGLGKAGGHQQGIAVSLAGHRRWRLRLAACRTLSTTLLRLITALQEGFRFPIELEAAALEMEPVPTLAQNGEPLHG